MVTQTLQQKLEELDDVLKKYDEKLYLNKITLKPVDIEIGISKIKAMHHEDIYEMALQWEYYVAGLQKEINHQQALLTWVESNLKRLLESRASNINEGWHGYKFEERQAEVLANDEYAKKLYKVKCNITMKINTLSYLPQKITSLCKFACEIAESKKWSVRNVQRTD